MPHGYSKELLLVIRKARRIQEIHHELTDNLHISSKVPLKIRTLKDDPEKVALEERVRSGIHLPVIKARYDPGKGI